MIRLKLLKLLYKVDLNLYCLVIISNLLKIINNLLLSKHGKALESFFKLLNHDFK